jgi:hypothetical protein
LRNKGFKQRIKSHDPLCRWIIGNTIVDFMPTDTKILGFSNLWYSDAIQNYTLQKMPCGKTIKIVTPPYFIGTKIEAFLGRGNNDFIMSHDIEDIITIIDGREELTLRLNWLLYRPFGPEEKAPDRGGLVPGDYTNICILIKLTMYIHFCIISHGYYLG